MWIYFEKLFLSVLEMSFTAGIVILLVLLFRLFLKRAPRLCSYLLWAAVLFRLLCPFSFSGSFSLLGFVDAAAKRGGMEASGGVPREMQNPFSEAAGNVEIEGQGYLDSTKKNSPDGKEQTTPWLSEGTGQGVLLLAALRAGACIWLAGILVMLCRGTAGLVRIRKRLVGSVLLRDNIYLSDHIDSPFVLGILRPGIYLPSTLDREEAEYILLHERTHIRRKDPAIKTAAYAALTIHWFNPLVWLAFLLAERDMEMSCDEAVLRKLGSGIRADYSETLLALSTGRRRIAGAPLAFGEGNVTVRIRNILRYRKPAAGVLLLSVLAALTVSACLMTDPAVEDGVSVQKETVPQDGSPDGPEAVSQLPEEEAEKRQAMDDALGETAGRQETEQELERWAQAVCGRDGRTVLSMCSQELRVSLEEEGMADIETGAFGWSSPWPWGQEDYRIMEMTDGSARILYYAWTSDPHVTVWKQELTWHREGETLVMDTANLDFLDFLCIAEEFYRAYPDGIIDGTQMDYTSNGAGEALDRNARADRENPYWSQLFAPEEAAGVLLNLLNNENKVELTSEEGKEGVQITIHFLEDDSRAYVTMVQPYGEDGIWIPQTFKEQ